MHELASVYLSLRPHTNSKLPVWLGQATHAIFMRTLQQIHPILSETLHTAPQGVQPFTAGTLDTVQRIPTCTPLSPGQDVSLRYTTFQSQVTGLLLHGMLPIWQANGITVHDQHLEVVAVYQQRHEHALAGLTTYEDLLNSATRKKTIAIHFKSPTAFKRSGHFIPLPEPQLVFGSLIERWNAYSPILMPDDLRDMVAEYVTIESHTIHTEAIPVKKHITASGFVGKVLFRIHSNDAALRQYLHALARFAHFSGIGARTAVGLGQAYYEEL